jgi:diguanylate cyclase (GGDEF)-like protein
VTLVGRRLQRGGRAYAARFGAPSIIAAIWSVGFIAWIVTANTNNDRALYVSDLAPAVLAGLASVTAARTAHSARSNRRSKLAWSFFAAGLAAWTAAELTWAWLELVKHTDPFPSVADIGYSLYYPALFIGFMAFPSQRRTFAERVRLGLDISVIALSGVIAVWYFILGPTLTTTHGLSLATTLSVAYPVGDMIVVFGLATALLRRTPGRSTLAIQILVAAAIANVVGDLIFARLDLSGSYDGTGWPDVCWMLAIAGFVIAADVQHREHRRRGGAATDLSSSAPAISLAPYLAVAVTLALLIDAVGDSGFYPLNGVALGAVVVTALVVTRQIATFRDHQTLLAAYQRLARTDQLTGVLSRSYLLERAGAALADCERQSLPIAVLMVDVDRFKRINDSRGHAAGDESLQRVAAVCRAETRQDSALVGRYGGDEFVIVLPGVDEPTSSRVADRIVDAVSSSPQAPDCDIDLSVSIGLASSHGATNIEALLRDADDALYVAKRAGRGRAHSARDGHPASSPPSTTSDAPVTYWERSLTR